VWDEIRRRFIGLWCRLPFNPTVVMTMQRPRAAFGWTFYGVAAGLKVVREARNRGQGASTLTLLAPPGFLPL